MGFMYTDDTFHSKSQELNYYTHRQIYTMLGMTPTPLQEHLLDGVLDVLYATRRQGATTGLIIYAIYLSQFGLPVTIHVHTEQDLRHKSKLLQQFHKQLYPVIAAPIISTYIFSENTNKYVDMVSRGYHRKMVHFGYGGKHNTIKSTEKGNNETKMER